MVDLEALEEGVAVGGVYTLERNIRHDRTGAFFAALTRDGERLLIKLVPERPRSRSSSPPGSDRGTCAIHICCTCAMWAAMNWKATVTFTASSSIRTTPRPGARTGSAQRVGDARRAGSGARRAALPAWAGTGARRGDPDHIVAVGEKVKLATDALRESDDLEGHPEDVRQLGELCASLRAPDPAQRAACNHRAARYGRGRTAAVDAGGDRQGDRKRSHRYAGCARPMPAPVPLAVTRRRWRSRGFAVVTPVVP